MPRHRHLSTFRATLSGSGSPRVGLLLAALLAVSAPVGCCGTGLYSVRYHHQQPLPPPACGSCDVPAGAACPCGGQGEISLFDALAATCGPPELFNEELYAAGPGEIVAPFPKYHPLPTRPAFEPVHFPISPAAAHSEPPPPGSPSPRAGEVAAGEARWRGPAPRFNAVRTPASGAGSLAYNPLGKVEFPPLKAKHREPSRLLPEVGQPLRSASPEPLRLR